MQPTVITTLLVIAAMSALTFTAYARDKRAAQRGAWRTPEATPHILSLLGGWPGAFIAQRMLHHKTRKPGFQFLFAVSVAANLGALFLLLACLGPFGERLS
jgi:uncharacterized membrane protein YsdA (DUF1294 family)